MARVRACGGEFTATPIRQIDDTTWEMRAEQHSSRVVPGAIVTIKTNEIIEMSAAEMPQSDGLAELEVAMAQERKTLKSPTEILAEVQAKAKAEREAAERIGDWLDKCNL